MCPSHFLSVLLSVGSELQSDRSEASQRAARQLCEYQHLSHVSHLNSEELTCLLCFWQLWARSSFKLSFIFSLTNYLINTFVWWWSRDPMWLERSHSVSFLSLLFVRHSVMMSDYLQPADWSSAVMTSRSETSRFNTKVRITLCAATQNQVRSSEPDLTCVIDTNKEVLLKANNKSGLNWLSW